MYVIRIVDSKGKPTGKVYALVQGVMFELGVPLTSHEGWTFVDWPEAVYNNWFKASTDKLGNLKRFFAY